MSNKSIRLAKNDILFKEGDASEAMYLIKSGRIAVFRLNASKDKEIILSEKVQGELLGEMAFFDNQARSAGAKAVVPTELVELPFKALQEQLQESPMWLKVMVKTIITQLRKANVRIRNLENITEDTYDKVSPQTLLSICSVIHLLACKSPKDANGKMAFSYKELYFYSRQTFGQRSAKIRRVVALLQDLQILKVTGEIPTKNSEETEGQGQMVTVLEHKTLIHFIEWFSGHLAASDAERILLDENELKLLQILNFYTKGVAADKDGFVKLNLNEIQKTSLKDTGLTFTPKEVDGLSKKGLVRDRSLENNEIYTRFQPLEVKSLQIFWSIIHGSTRPINN